MKKIDVMVNIIGTPCFNTIFDPYIVERDKIQIVVKVGQTDCICVVECSW